MSLSETYLSRKKLLADNLKSMGVSSVNETDGLTTLINAVLDIEQSVINPQTPLVLEADKSILSHYDNDNCTLTATLLDNNGNGVSGEEIVFKANGGVLGTVITGDTGVAQYTYQSTGGGDVTITAEGMNLTKTLGIEDCIIANVNASYTGTSTSDTVYSLGYDEIADLSSIDFEFSFKFHQTKYGCDVCLGASSEFTVSPIKSNYRIFIGNSGRGNTRHGYRTTSTSNIGGSSSGEVSLNTTHNMKIVKEGSMFKYYLNDRFLGSETITFWANYHMFGVHTVQWNTGTTTISDLKIKQI